MIHELLGGGEHPTVMLLLSAGGIRHGGLLTKHASGTRLGFGWLSGDAIWCALELEVVGLTLRHDNRLFRHCLIGSVGLPMMGFGAEELGFESIDNTHMIIVGETPDVGMPMVPA